MLRKTVLAVATLLISTSGVYAQTTLLSLNSQPGDYIGQGEQRTLTVADGWFSANNNFDNGVSLSFHGNDPSVWWYLDFAAPGNLRLAPGVYEHATRFPFQQPAAPGLSVSGEGRGCNTLTGRFEVFEATYGPSGEVLTFAADFEQHCEGAGPALSGSIRYNAGPVPSRCTARTATMKGLNEDVAARVTSANARYLLTGILMQAQSALDKKSPRNARNKLVDFIEYVVAYSHLSSSDSRYIKAEVANDLTCATANVMTNLLVP
jgi:hypothetical protein